MPALLLLVTNSWGRRLVFILILVQMVIATFVAITMMGWWFPGRTMLTVLPLFVVPLACLAAHSGTFARMFLAALGAYTLTITAGLAVAARTGEITIAVDPFDMTFVPFQAIAGLFPLYTWWTSETWQLTYLWWALLIVSAVAVTWPETCNVGRGLADKYRDTVGKRDPGLPPDE